MAFDFRDWLWGHMPAGLVGKLRWLRRTYRRRKYYSDRLLGRDAGLERADLELAFREAGLVEGDLVLVHSAMSGLGLVQGGAETIIEALRTVLGPSGTLAMPTFCVRRSMLEQVESGDVFDVRRTPSQTGKVTEVFRQYPEVVRSVHPTHSVAALGPRATWLTAEHHRCPTAFGVGSPFGRLIEAQGKILCLGVRISYITSYHAFEDQTPDFPEAVYLPGTFHAPVVDQEGHRFDVVLRIHDPQMSVRRIEKRPEVLKCIRDYLTESGRLQTIPLGKGTLHVVGARELNDALGELLLQGITIYSREKEA